MENELKEWENQVRENAIRMAHKYLGIFDDEIESSAKLTPNRSEEERHFILGTYFDVIIGNMVMILTAYSGVGVKSEELEDLVVNNIKLKFSEYRRALIDSTNRQVCVINKENQAPVQVN